MGRPCGGAHEISGIKAPLFLHGWVVGGFLGWVGGGVVCRDGWVSDGGVGGWVMGWRMVGVGWGWWLGGWIVVRLGGGGWVVCW